ncbi:MAG TPA: TolC family protein [Limnochordales bacterium]
MKKWSEVLRRMLFLALAGLLGAAPVALGADDKTPGTSGQAAWPVSSAGAAHEGETVLPWAQAIQITVADAVQQALVNSPELTLARLAVAEAEIALQEAAIGRMAGQPESAYRDARDKLQEARDAYTDQLVQVALRVEEAYYNVLRSYELFAIQESNQEQADRQLAVARARYEAGLIARQDLLEAELNHEQSRLSLEKAARDVEEAHRRLAELMGAVEGAPLLLVEEVRFSPLRIDLEDALAEAVAQRAEVVRAQRAVEQAREQVAQADNPYAAPVELRRAQFNLERAEIQLEQARTQVRQQVRQEWFQLLDAEQQVAMTGRQEELARTRVEISRARYEAGLISLLELLRHEAEYAQARLNAAGAVWDYNLAKARFLRTLGRSELPPLPFAIEEYINSWEELE